MGMFDYFKCSKDIGKLTDVDCQSKEFDFYGGTCSFYWVDPAGMLWSPDYQGTSAFEYAEDETLPIWNRIKCVPTGSHGRMLRVYLTNYVTVYTSKTDPDGFTEFTNCRLHFVDGILQDYAYINNST